MGRRKRKNRKMQRVVRPSVLLDIIIPVHRNIDLLQQCVESIPEAVGELSYHVTIVDNGTPKEEKVYYRDIVSDPHITVVEFPNPLGFPLACNKGAKITKAPLMFFLNSDVVLQPNSLVELVKALDEPSIGVAGMKLLFPKELADGINPAIRPANKVQHIGLHTTIRGEIAHAYIGWSADHPKVNAVWEMYAVTGAALLTRRTIWKKVGGFSLDYGMGTYEDVDFCLKVRELGYNIVVNPKAVGTHVVGATAEKYKIPYPLNQNRMLFMSKWGNKLQYTEWKSW